MMKGMTNYFPLAGTRWARPAGERKRRRRGGGVGGGGGGGVVNVCAPINPHYSASHDRTVTLRKLAAAFNDTIAQRLTGGR